MFLESQLYLLLKSINSFETKKSFRVQGAVSIKTARADQNYNPGPSSLSSYQSLGATQSLERNVYSAIYMPEWDFRIVHSLSSFCVSSVLLAKFLENVETARLSERNFVAR